MKTIPEVINEFNIDNYPHLRCEVVEDEGEEYPKYVVENRSCLRVAEMQCGMMEILRYKQHTPDFGLKVSQLFKDIYTIEEEEDE